MPNRNAARRARLIYTRSRPRRLRVRKPFIGVILDTGIMYDF